MKKPADWTVNVETLSEREIVRLLEQLKGSTRHDLITSLRQRLIQIAVEEGGTRDEIIKTLSQNVARGLSLHALAKEWAPLFGITVAEFKRIANLG
jgi:hypothetical protein